MIIEFASEVSNLAWRVSQSQNGGAIFTLMKWWPMFGSVVFDYQWCILIVMSVKSSFYNEYDIKNNEKHMFWTQRSFQNHHQTFHDRCPEKIGPLPKKSDHWFTRTCPENMGLAPTWVARNIWRNSLRGPKACGTPTWRVWAPRTRCTVACNSGFHTLTRSDLTPLCQLLVSSRQSCRQEMRKNDNLFHFGIMSVLKPLHIK